MLADADLAPAAEICAAARLYNTGQSCVAAKRFIVIEKVRAQFESLLIKRLSARSLGDPRDPTTDLGPLARADLRDELVALSDEYSAAASPEAILAKGFDKLETMLQHLVGRNEPGFDYRFNLDYGAQHTARHPLLAQLRGLVDRETQMRVATDTLPEGG